MWYGLYSGATLIAVKFVSHSVSSMGAPSTSDFGYSASAFSNYCVKQVKITPVG